MLEPLDIDINLNQNISDEAPRAAQASAEMTQSAIDAQKEIDRLSKVVEDLNIALEEQRKQAASTEQTNERYTTQIEEIQQRLDKANKELVTYRDLLEQANRATQEGADVGNVLADTREALSNTEADLIDSTRELAENQEGINDMLDDAAESSDTYSASNQILSEALKRVASALGIENTYILNAIGNVHTMEAAKKGWTTATKELTAAQKLLVATGIMAVIVAIATAIYYVKSLYDEQRKLKSSFDDVNKVGARSRDEISKQTATYEKLRREWESLGDSLEDKKKFIDDNKDAFNELGISVTDVKDAENLLVTNTDAVIAALRARAEGAVYAQLAAEKLKEYGDKMDESEERFYNPAFGDKAKDVFKSMGSQITGAFDWIKYGNFTGKSPFEIAMEESKKMRDDAKKSLDDHSQAIDNQIKKEKQYIDILQKAGIITKKEADEAKKKREEEAKRAKAAIANQQKGQQSQDKASDSLAKKSADYQKRINDARVKAIQEGAEQERAAAKAEYDETQAFIEKELKEIAELEKKTGKPATEQREGLLMLDVESTRQYENEIARINANSKAILNGIFTEVNARFADELQRNIADINQYYDSLIAEAKKAGAAIEEVQALQDAKAKDITRAGIDDELRKADLGEALELEKAANLESIGLTTAAEQTKYEIAKRFLELRIELLRKRGDEASNKEADILEERLKGLQTAGAPKSITGLVNSKLFDGITKGFEKTGMSADDAKAKASSLFGDIQKGGATAADAIGMVKGMFGGLSEEFDAMLDSLGNIAAGFATGGIAGGVVATIGAGISLFSHYRKVDKEHQQALKELAFAKIQLQREYNLLLLKEQLYYKQGSNIFGTDQINGAINSIENYRDAISKLKDEAQGDWTPNAQLEKALENQVSKGGLFGMLYKGQLEDYKQHLDAYNKGVAALADVEIVTGSKKTGALWWRKRKDVYSPLLKVYDDLIDKEGKLNTVRIEAVLNNEKMSDENRALLQSLLDLSAAADEAEQQLRDYLSQTFGSLGNSLADSIVQGWRDGTTDGLEIFRGSVTDVLNDFSKQMIHTLFLKKLFDGLENDIAKAYNDLADEKINEKQLSNKVTDILGGFFNGLGGDVEKANQFLEDFWKNAEAAGFDRPDAERTGMTGGGLATASQDSINEFNGLLYATRQMIGDIRQDGKDLLLVQRTYSEQLDVLVERSEYWLYLEKLDAMQKSLDAIETYGIKMNGL